MQRKSSRLEKTKTMETPTPTKRTKETTSGPGKKRKTLQISSSHSKEETGGRLIQHTVQEVKNSTGRRAWRPKVDNLNMQIINDNNFVQLNKYYDLYNRMDTRQLENVVV